RPRRADRRRDRAVGPDSRSDTPARAGTRWSASTTGRRQSPSGCGLPYRTARGERPTESHTAYGGGWHVSGLALLGVSPVRWWTVQWDLRETSMWVNIQRITGVAHCAHVVWPD